jgi:hypothetical protein
MQLGHVVLDRVRVSRVTKEIDYEHPQPFDCSLHLYIGSRAVPPHSTLLGNILVNTFCSSRRDSAISPSVCYWVFTVLRTYSR